MTASPQINNPQWLIDQRVILSRVGSEVTIDESRAGIRLVGEMMRTGTPPVHLIIDMRGVTKFTTNFREVLPEIMQFHQDGDTAWTIMITNNSLIRFFGVFVANITRGRFRLVQNVPDAIALLRQVDASLNTLAINTVVEVDHG